MINKVHLIKYLAVYLFFLSLSAQQVQVSLANVKYTNNGQPQSFVSGCGLIDLKSSSNTVITMTVNLATSTSVINNSASKLYVFSKKSPSATRIQRFSKTIPSTNWTPGSVANSLFDSLTISFSITAADFNATGGSLLVIFETPSGTELPSPCTFQITKTPPPSFTLTPITVGLACGDTASRTFTVTAANIPAGVTPSYSWSAPGSTQVGPTTNSATFQPSSGPNLPLDVSVTPILNGVAQPTMTCTFTRAPFTSTAAISGADAICTIGASAVYTINAGSGNTVAWSSSSPAIATISNPTNSQVTVTRQAPGDFTLDAAISNPCNQSVIVTPKTINGSAPQFNSFAFGDDSAIEVGPGCFTTSLQSLVIFANFNGMTSSEVKNNSNWEWEPFDNLIYMNYAGNRGQVVPLQSGTSNFKVRAKNACGWSDWVDYQLFDITECPFNFRTSTIYTVYPNPSKDIVNIELKDSKIKPEKEAIVSGTLFDLMGQSRRKVEIKNNSASLTVAGLKKGIYVLQININGKVEGHQLIVE